MRISSTFYWSHLANLSFPCLLAGGHSFQPLPRITAHSMHRRGRETTATKVAAFYILCISTFTMNRMLMLNHFGRGLPSSNARNLRATLAHQPLVGRPTQLICIWISIFWVVGGNPLWSGSVSANQPPHKSWLYLSLTYLPSQPDHHHCVETYSLVFFLLKIPSFSNFSNVFSQRFADWFRYQQSPVLWKPPVLTLVNLIERRRGAGASIIFFSQQSEYNWVSNENFLFLSLKIFEYSSRKTNAP